ncbi:MFS transporter [Nocardioides sp. InS609-2]|uniref:MFS transporter n=1 Tax=Nocardioides sp. InS609-2 TaxID=2760705 RepID=UPI0020C01FFE|nr:MFS transporter [Nocardioides sp. InS609-2]
MFAHQGFARFWLAETVSGFGSYVTTVAIQVLVVLTLRGSAADVGFVNAARWLPYLLLGLVVGALVDRRRRQPVLVVTDLGRAVLLGVIPLLWFLDRLTLPVLMGVMVVFGTLSLLNDAATQSLLPRLVPRSALLAANARLDQSASVAQTSGPVVGGALVTALGAPLAVLVDSLSYLVSGVLTATVRVSETVAPRDGKLHLRREIGEGLAFVYRHRVLSPFAITTHGWFLFNSALTTVFVPFALIGLGLSAFELGVVLAAAGVGGLLGSLAATRLGLRWGAGRTVIGCQILMPVAWAIVVLAPGREEAHVLALVVVACGQFLYGIALGVSNANSMGYRQAATPDALQGRMNTTMRSVNRAMIVVGAPVGGLLADALGFRPVMWIGAAGLVLVALALALSPFRHAVHEAD